VGSTKGSDRIELKAASVGGVITALSIKLDN
jgi:hypothetical protein